MLRFSYRYLFLKSLLVTTKSDQLCNTGSNCNFAHHWIWGTLLVVDCQDCLWTPPRSLWIRQGDGPCFFMFHGQQRPKTSSLWYCTGPQTWSMLYYGRDLKHRHGFRQGKSPKIFNCFVPTEYLNTFMDGTTAGPTNLLWKHAVGLKRKSV